MSKFVAFLLCSILLFSLISVEVSAEEPFTWYDLSSYGVPSLKGIASLGEPIRDGVISRDEYGFWNELKDGDLRLVVSSPVPMEVENTGVSSQNIAISYDEDYLYFAIVTNFTDPSLWQSVDYTNFGNLYGIEVFLGMSDEDCGNLRSSGIELFYGFDPDTLRCVGTTATVTARNEAGHASFVSRFSTFSGSTVGHFFTDEHGILWDGHMYRSSCALKREGNTLIFEGMIPMGDAMRALDSNDASRVTQTLASQSGSLCVSFGSRLTVGVDPLGNPVKLSLGLFSEEESDAEPSTWREVFGRFDSTLSAAVTYFAAPLYLVGDPPDDSDSTEQSDTSTGAGSESGDGASSQPPSDFPYDGEETPITEDSFQDLLPDSEVYDDLEDELISSNEAVEEEEKTLENMDRTALILTLVAGILLFISTVFALYHFARSERKEKNGKNKEENRDKKRKSR